MFGLKRIDLGNFGNGLIPKFDVTNLNIETIHNDIHKKEVENKRVLKTSNDIFASINRRYNKFMYAYYNKPKDLDKEKINKCYQKTKRFMVTLQHMHRKLIANRDPRAENFGKKVAQANDMVQRYGAYVMRLNQGKYARPRGKVNGNRNKVRK
jgi:hypothetical protein